MSERLSTENPPRGQLPTRQGIPTSRNGAQHAAPTPTRRGLRKRAERLFDIAIGVEDIFPARPSARMQWWVPYVWGALVVALCTEVSRVMSPFPYFELDNVVMIYMLGIVVVAMRYGRGPAVLASALSVLAINLLFIPKYLTTVLSGAEGLLTFGPMVLIAIVISSLAVRIKQQAEQARQGELRAAALSAMSSDLAGRMEIGDLLRVSTQHIGDVFRSQVVILLPGPAGRLEIAGDKQMVSDFDSDEEQVAQWASEHQQLAGASTQNFPTAKAMYVPLIASRGTVGMLGLRPMDTDRALPPDQLHLLEIFANQAALAIERAHLAQEAQQAQVQIETERLRNSLLSSVSHDLRTPLTAITGATSTLVDSAEVLDPATRRELILSVYDEADRLNRLVRNLLDMTRIESGTVLVHKEWQPLEEVVGAALMRMDKQLDGRPVHTDLPADLPLVPLDEVLIEQVLINLLENAVKYTPPETPIDILAHLAGPEGASPSATGAVLVEVMDRGPGLTQGDEQRIFEKFYRAQRRRSESSGEERGVGLGLTICRGIVEAHGGRIWAHNRPGGGAVFSFTLPLGSQPPEIPAMLSGEPGASGVIG
jgi:two-component system sensor histidine kinase KdpD